MNYITSSDRVTMWRKKTKLRALAAFDNCCGICGYSKCVNALEFHHLDPEEKDFSISTANCQSWEKIVEELKKCICVCSNCHKEIHYINLEIPADIKRFDNNYENYHLVEGSKKECPICKSVMKNSLNFCSPSCAKEGKRSLSPTDIEEIVRLKDQENKSYVYIAKMFRVSDKTIAKWYKKHKEAI